MAEHSTVLQRPEITKPATRREQSRATRGGTGRGSYLPAPEQRKIQARFIAGNSIRRIARDTGHHQATIARVVKSEEVQTYLKQVREKLFAVADDAVERVRAEIRGGKQGAWLAFELLKGIGVFLQQSSNQGPAITAPLSEQD